MREGIFLVAAQDQDIRTCFAEEKTHVAETPAARALQKVLDKKYEVLQRVEDRGVSAARARITDRQQDAQPRIFEGRRGR